MRIIEQSKYLIIQLLIINVICINAFLVFNQMYLICFIFELMSKETRKKIFFTNSQSGERRYQFRLGWGSAPHPDKVWKGGEDSLYVSKNIIIVADGVGGWSRMGIDSAVYSRRLISAVKQLVVGQKQLYFIQRPEQLAVQAVQRNEEKGSATLSIITVHPNTGIIRSYYIGDSVFGIFSQTGKSFIAQQQQRQFNVPFQVFGGMNNKPKEDSDSDEQKPVSDAFNGKYNQFSYAQLSQKIIVLASDGLWDNMPEQQIKEQLFANGSDLITKTRALVKRAKELAFLPQYDSPFYLKAVKKGQSVPKCGKIDDITLIIAEIVLVGN